MARAQRRGFSAVEILLVLGLSSVIAAIAMYVWARSVRRAKTSEARESITRLATGAADFYNHSDATQPSGANPQAVHAMRHFPPTSRLPVPGEPLSVRGQRYQSNKADWAASPWRDLGFSIIQPQYYQYSFDASGAGTAARAKVIAQGDLNGDGTRSRYALTVTPDESLTAIVSKEMEQTDPEE